MKSLKGQLREQKNSPSRLRKSLSFSQRKKDIPLKENQNTKEVSTPVKLVQDLKEITLKEFLNCYYRSDFSSLILQGQPTEEQIEQCWEGIILKYLDYVGGNNQKIYLSAFRSLVELRLDVELVKILKELLETVYSKDFAQQLNQICGESYEFNPIDWENYLEEINECCSTFIRDSNIQIKLKKLEIDSIESSEEEGEKIKENDFYVTLVNLSNHASIGLNDSINMLEYCIRYSQYIEYCETVKNQLNESKS